MRKVGFIILLFILAASCSQKKKDNELNVRLKWQYQAQFAGYIIAKEKGFYSDRGLVVNLEPAGPDLKPYLTVASGSDQIGIGVPNQIITAQANGIPLVSVAQMMQDSPFRFVIKNKNRIDSLQQLKGKDVGLWMGGDEAEFVSMLQSVGMDINDVNVIPQDFSIAPFLEDRYVLSHVSVYNELNLIKSQGYGEKDSLQILSPKDYNSAILGDMIFCMSDFVNQHPQEVADFIEASIEGWKYARAHTEEAIDLILKYNPELEREHQIAQLEAALALMFSGDAESHGIGYINPKKYQDAMEILLKSGQLDKRIDIHRTYNSSAWDTISIEIKAMNDQLN